MNFLVFVTTEELVTKQRVNVHALPVTMEIIAKLPVTMGITDPTA